MLLDRLIFFRWSYIVRWSTLFYLVLDDFFNHNQLWIAP